MQKFNDRSVATVQPACTVISEIRPPPYFARKMVIVRGCTFGESIK